MKKSKDEILQMLSEKDDVELMEIVQDSLFENPAELDTIQGELNQTKENFEKLQNDYNDLKNRYKERFFTNEKEEVPNPEQPKGLHEEKILKVDNIFKEVKLWQ